MEKETFDKSEAALSNNEIASPRAVSLEDDCLKKNQVFIEKNINEGVLKANIKTQVFTYSKPLLSFVADFSMSLSIIYNSKNSGISNYGGIETRFFKGWQTNFHQYCYKLGNNYIYVDGNGFKHVFISKTDSSSNVYCDSCGTGLKLEIKNNCCVIKSLNNEELIFTQEGRLSKIRILKNLNWHETSVWYGSLGQITSVTDSLNNEFNFSYSTSSPESVSITDSIGRCYSVTGENLTLLALRENGNSGTISENFSYSSITGMLTKIEDYNNTILNISYPNTVKMFLQLSVYKNSLAQIIEQDTIEQIGSITQITNQKGIIKRYFYDSKNECTSSYEVKYGQCFGAAFTSNDDFAKYSYSLSKRYCYLGNYNGYNTFPANPGISPKVLFGQKDIAMIAGKKYILSLEIDVPNTINGIPEQIIKLFDGDRTQLTEQKIVLNSFGKQIFIFPLGKISLKDNFYVLIGNLSNTTITYSNVKISEEIPSNTLETLYCNKDTGNSFITDAKGVKWYLLKSPLSLIVNGAYKYPKVTKEDYFANFYSFAGTANGSFDAWYNGLTSITNNVTSLIYDFGGANKHDVSNLKLATCLEKDGANFITSYEIDGSEIVCNLMNLNSSSLKADTVRLDKRTRLVKSSQDSNNIKTSLTYDSDGNITQEKTAHTTLTLNNITLDKTYENGKLKTETDYFLNDVNTVTYNSSAAAIDSIKDARNQLTSFSYNSYKDIITNVSSSVNGSENANSISYSNKLPQTMSHSGMTYSYVYDEYNRISDVKIGGQSYCPTILTRLGSTDEITSTYKNDTLYARMKREFDEYGRLRRVFFKFNSRSDFKEAISFIYSSDPFLGQSATSPTDSGLYPAESSQLIKVIDTLSKTNYVYLYDKNGLLSRVTASSTGTDGKNLDKVLGRDSLNRLTSETYSGIINSSVQYDNNGIEPSQKIKSTFVYPSGTAQRLADTSYFDNLNRLSYSNIASYTYTLSNSYVYADRVNINTSVGTTPYVKNYSAKSNKSTSLDYSNNLTYDKNFNLTKIMTTDNSTTKSVDYTYDAANRLTKEVNGQLYRTISFFYDNNGNITQKRIKQINGGDEATYNYEYNHSRGKDILTKYNGMAIDYDACLNPTNYMGSTLTWQRGRLLTKLVNPASGRTSEFFYDTMGNRTKVVTSLSNYTANRTQIRDGSKLISETVSIPQIGVNYSFIYLYTQSGLNGFSLNGRVYTYRKNILGDVVAILDDNHNIIAKYDYEAFGKCHVYKGDNTTDTSITSIGNLNSIRYRSYNYDFETNLYYLQSRYYDPETGRFINADDVSYLSPETINGLNLFAYCLNNPIMLTDSSGHFPEWLKWVGLAVGAIFVTGAIVALSVVTGGAAAGLGTAILLGAAKGTLIGAGIGIIAGGAIGYAVGGVDGILDGMMIGFGGGALAGAIIGGAWGGITYGLQQAGVIATKVPLKSLLNNPLDEFVTIGPKAGQIAHYAKSIAETGKYGQIFVSKLANGMFQIANGHHRIAALVTLGYEFVRVFLTK